MEEKKQIERTLVEGFRSFYPDFPKGKLVASESPDFIVRTQSDHYLGIELTRLHPVTENHLTDEEKSRNSAEEKVVERALEIYSRSGDRPLFVKFLFSPGNSVGTERILSVSALAVQAIRKNLPSRKPDRFTSQVINGEQLPEGLQSMLLLSNPKLEVPVWEKANNLGISNDILSDITASIRKKDEKLRLYHKQRLHLYWLLVTADRLEGITSFNMENRILNHGFTSAFQHVFLYELMKERVFRLV